MGKNGWKNAKDKVQMEKCEWQNAEDKMQIKNYEWQYADDEILMIGNELFCVFVQFYLYITQAIL